MTVIDPLLTYLGRKFNTDFHYFAKGGFWLLLTQSITIVGSLLVAAVFANVLSETDYGTYRYLVAVAILFTTFSLTGMGQAILQTAAKGHTEFYPYGIRVSLLYNSLIAVGAIIGAGYYYLHGNTLLALGCVFIAFLQPIISTYQNIVPFLQGLKLFKKTALLQVFKIALITVASIATIYLTQNILILFFVFLFAQALANGLGSIVFRHKVSTEMALREDVRLKYLRYAKHLSVQNVIIGVASRLDSVLVFQYLGAVSMASFNIATLISDQARGAFKNLLTLLIPKFAKHDSIHQNRANVPLRSLQLFAVLVVVSAFIILVLPSVYGLLFPKYTTSIYYAQLLILALPASVGLIPLSALQSQLKDKELYSLNVYSSLLQIVVTVSLIPLLGLLGAILARIATQYVSTALTFYFLFKAK